MARSTFFYQQAARLVPDKYQKIKSTIKAIYDSHEGRYGYRRMTCALLKLGEQINHKTVFRLMVELGMTSRVKIKKYVSYKGNVGKAAPNLLKRRFKARRPNQKLVTDVTEFKVAGRKLYLSPVMDLHSGAILAYKTATRPVYEMVESMVTAVLTSLAPGDNPILHSDQGWQYRMENYVQKLKDNNIKQSMSRKGNCHDNAAMESFFGLLKSEFFHLKKFATIEELDAGLANYIHYYNHDRIKLKLGGLSPMEYRTKALCRIRKN